MMSFLRFSGLESGGEDAFRTAVRENMERDLKNALQGKTKSRVMAKLFDSHSDLDIPQALVANEIVSLKQQMHQKLTRGGENDFDASLATGRDVYGASQSSRYSWLGS